MESRGPSLMVNQINLMNIFTPYIFKIHFYIIFLSKHNHCISTTYTATLLDIKFETQIPVYLFYIYAVIK